ncbi:4a-hydroxytetrahydrobiopterin dehydratase [Methanobacterium alcaliphilum]|uniref:4a-hydroxytetrahydrobiopterin dehydratase n=1 Tax=Methanobacterium alcaliphilum TaxID=392018 RepID=UPI00200ABF49|nr:4a-hydroxytetrahydrobiopterin dehydratase [Methanobacterium alcaliphilum]MCK9152250.1 4a-hydroxytetrahydrobiopterin dehydratase [Methanobacterium alcaliphilum]
MKAPTLLSANEISQKIKDLSNWEIVENHHLIGVFEFSDLASSMHFAVKIGNLAEEMQHHPEIVIGTGVVELTIFTHDSGGLTQLDFDFAKKVEDIFK